MIFKTSDLVAVFSLLFIFLNIALFYHVLVKTIQQYKDYVNFGCNYVDGGMGAGGGGGGAEFFTCYFYCLLNQLCGAFIQFKGSYSVTK